VKTIVQVGTGLISLRIRLANLHNCFPKRTTAHLRRVCLFLDSFARWATFLALLRPWMMIYLGMREALSGGCDSTLVTVEKRNLGKYMRAIQCSAVLGVRVIRCPPPGSIYDPNMIQLEVRVPVRPDYIKLKREFGKTHACWCSYPID
jgi:hypothetical protein